jgi:hypothetical protein
MTKCVSFSIPLIFHDFFTTLHLGIFKAISSTPRSR